MYSVEVCFGCDHPIGYRPFVKSHPIRMSVLSNVITLLDFKVSDLL